MLLLTLNCIPNGRIINSKINSGFSESHHLPCNEFNFASFQLMNFL